MKSSFLFLLAIFLDLFSIALIIPFLTDFVAAVGFKNTDLGLIQSIYGTMQCISLPVTGYLMERFGKRKIILVSIFGTTFSLILNYLSISPTAVHPKTLFLLYRFVVGAIRQTVSISLAMAFDEAGEDGAQRAKSAGTVQAVVSIAFVLAPWIGGLAIDQFGLQNYALLAVGFSFASGILMLVATRDYVAVEKQKKKEKETDSNENPPASSLQRLLLGAKTVFLESGNDARLLVIAMFCSSACEIGLQFVNSAFLKSRFGLTSTQVGFCISLTSALRVVSQLVGVRFVLMLTKRWKFSLRWIVLSLAWIATLLGVFQLAISDDFVWYIVGIVIFSLSAAIVDSFSKASLSLHFGSANNALVVTLFSSVDGANRMFMPLINSALVTNFDGNVRAPLYLSALISLVSTLCHTFGTTASNVQTLDENVKKD